MKIESSRTDSGTLLSSQGLRGMDAYDMDIAGRLREGYEISRPGSASSGNELSLPHISSPRTSAHPASWHTRAIKPRKQYSSELYRASILAPTFHSRSYVPDLFNSKTEHISSSSISYQEPAHQALRSLKVNYCLLLFTALALVSGKVFLWLLCLNL